MIGRFSRRVRLRSPGVHHDQSSRDRSAIRDALTSAATVTASPMFEREVISGDLVCERPGVVHDLDRRSIGNRNI
jgi:hypothetical protein